MITPKKIVKYIRDYRYRFMVNDSHMLYNFLPDKLYLKYKFKVTMGYDLNLINPKTFNEKLQWLKLYDRKPEYTLMADKVKAKEYVAKKIGEEYVVPTLGVWDNPDDIDYDALPDQFVLKCNHNSGKGMYICRDKSFVDRDSVNRKLWEGLKENYYLTQREWPYRDINRKILAEKNLGHGLTDYRVYCFNGKPMYIYVYVSSSDSGDSKPEITSCNIYDTEWKELPFHQKSLPMGTIPVPAFLEEMLEASKKLSENIPMLRCDFYYTDRLYSGELTFYPGAGFSPFYPNEYDEILGGEIIL